MAQEQLIRSMYDAVNKHDVEKFVSFFNEDAQFKDVSTGHVFHGRSEIRDMINGWLKTFPDMNLRVSEIFGTGDKLVTELTLTGTHKGELELPEETIPASGKQVTVPSADVFRLKNDKIQSVNCYFAATVLMDQIGESPTRNVSPDRYSKDNRPYAESQLNS